MKGTPHVIATGRSRRRDRARVRDHQPRATRRSRSRACASSGRRTHESEWSRRWAGAAATSRGRTVTRAPSQPVAHRRRRVPALTRAEPGAQVAATQHGARRPVRYTRDIVRCARRSRAARGAAPGTAGIDSAAALDRAARWRGRACKPGGDGGDVLPELRGDHRRRSRRAVRASKCGGTALRPGRRRSSRSASRPTARCARRWCSPATASPRPGYDYDDYAGLDVHDKIVLVMTNEPGEMDSTSRFDGSVNTPHAELRTKAINAARARRARHAGRERPALPRRRAAARAARATAPAT